MQKTTNYHLSQWDAADRVLRADFNADNAAIDAALKANADAISAEATARESAISAVNSALALRGNCKIETFTYTGSGEYGTSHPTAITFPARPTFFIVVGQDCLLSGFGGDSYVHYSSTYNGAANGMTSASWSGNTVRLTSTYSAALQANGSGTYRVVGFTVLS